MPKTNRPFRALVAVFGVLVAAAAFAGPASAAGYTSPTTSTVSTQTPAVGSTFTLSGSGFGANELITNVLDTSPPTTLASVRADANGNFSLSVTLPAGVSGAHTIVSTGATTGHISTVTVTIAGTADDTPGTADDTPAAAGSVLAATGATVISIGSLAALLLFGGVLMVFSSRRRRVNS